MKVKGISKAELERCVAHFERFGHTYFWHGGGNAASRRYEEQKNSRTWTFFVDGVKVVADVQISISCHNYYSYRSVTVGDERKRQMVPYLKKLLEKGEF